MKKTETKSIKNQKKNRTEKITSPKWKKTQKEIDSVEMNLSYKKVSKQKVKRRKKLTVSMKRKVRNSITHRIYTHWYTRIT